jgi:hypothetical protein
VNQLEARRPRLTVADVLTNALIGGLILAVGVAAGWTAAGLVVPT